jgi:hypothetical protein
MVDRNQAISEFEKWLEFKKINERKRQEMFSFEETIIDAIEEGRMTIDDKMQIELNLHFPLKNEAEEIVLGKLSFKPRIRLQELNSKLKGIKPGDGDARIVAYMAALTSVNSGLLSKLYTEDTDVCQAICMYFL